MNKRTVRELSLRELLKGLVGDRAHAQIYRDETCRRQAETGKDLYSLVVAECLSSSKEKVKEEIVEEFDIISNYKYESSMSKVCDLVLSSGWNFRDPGRLMKKLPESVKGFLMSPSVRASNYEELMGKNMAGLFDMIMDSYSRWTSVRGGR